MVLLAYKLRANAPTFSTFQPSHPPIRLDQTYMTSGYKYPAGASRAGWLPALNRRQRAESRSPLHPAKTTEEDHDACELSRNGIDSGWVCEDDDAESDDANSEDGNSIGWYVLVEEEWDGEDPPEVESPVAVGIGATEGTIALADAEESTESINSTAKAEKGQATPFSVVGRQQCQLRQQMLRDRLPPR